MKLILLTLSLLYAASTGPDKAAPSAHDEARSAEKKAETSPNELPSSLSKSNLCAELQLNARTQLEARRQLEVERTAIKKEKARLEEMLKEIEKARSDLRNETKRLEQLIAKADAKRKAGSEGAEADGEKAQSAKGTSPNSANAKKPSSGAKGGPPARDPQEEWEALAKTLKSMKPEQAAALLSRTKKSLTAEVLRRMKPSDAGAVIEKLKPELAAEMLAAMVSGSGTEGAPEGDIKKEKRE